MGEYSQIERKDGKNDLLVNTVTIGQYDLMNYQIDNYNTGKECGETDSGKKQAKGTLK